jgi:hypothetical protein
MTVSFSSRTAPCSRLVKVSCLASFIVCTVDVPSLNSVRLAHLKQLRRSDLVP